jgi:hypothetical protein
MSLDENIVDFPKVETITPEERARRLKVEVERLAGLSTVDWMYWTDREDHAELYGVTTAQLRKMVQAVVKENDKKANEAKKEERQRDERAEKERTAAQQQQRKDKEREQERKRKQQEQAEKEARKEVDRKQREREKEFTKLFKLPSAEHEPRLAELAKRLGEDLDLMRDEFNEFVVVSLPRSYSGYVEPWPDPVDTKTLLIEVMAQLRRYVVVHDDAAAIAIVLWICFAWVHADIAVHSPLLVFDSAEGDTGKTTACGVIKFATPRGYTAAELTGPNLYRFVDQLHPTLIIDDADKLLERKPDLVHIVNVSWTRGTLIPRQLSGTTYWFDPFCPKVIAGVNVQLPRTTATRKITIKLLPKLPHEKVDEFNHVDDDEFITLRRKLARWAADNVAALKDACPVMVFNNRLRMNWKLLLAIADLAGDNWPKLARQAAVKLARERREPSEGKRLLAAFRDLFAAHGSMLTSAKVQELLTADPSSEWADFRGRGRPITQREIALLLDPYGIDPTVIHPDGHKAERGYKVEWFEKAFLHFLAKRPAQRTTVRTPREKSARKPRGKSKKWGRTVVRKYR